MSRLRRALPVLAALSLFGLAAVEAFGGSDPSGPDGDRIRGGDFVSYWAGGTILAEGDVAHLYATRRAHRVFKALYPVHPPTYPMGYPPPLYQVLGAPQPALSYFDAAKALPFAMAALQVLAVGLVVGATAALRPWRREAFAAGLLLPAGFSALATGQLAGVWMLSLAGAWALRARGRPGAAGLALALLFAKPTLGLPVLGAFALCGEGAVVAGMVAGGAAMLALSLAAGGTAPWEAWLERMRDPAKIALAYFDHWARELTMRTLFSSFIEDKALSRLLGWVGMGVGALVTLGVALRARTLRVAAPDDALARGLGVGAVLVAALLSSPHLLDYDAGLYLPSLASAAAWLLSGRARWPRIGLATSAVSWAVGAWPGLHHLLGVSVFSGGVLAWVLWMACELRAARALLLARPLTAPAARPASGLPPRPAPSP